MWGNPVASTSLPVGSDTKVTVAKARPGRGHVSLVLVRGVDDQVGWDEGTSASASSQQRTLHPCGVVAATLLTFHT